MDSYAIAEIMMIFILFTCSLASGKVCSRWCWPRVFLWIINFVCACSSYLL